MEVKSIISNLLPLHFLHKDSYFLCSILCAEKSEIEVQGSPKSALGLYVFHIYTYEHMYFIFIYMSFIVC